MYALLKKGGPNFVQYVREIACAIIPKPSDVREPYWIDMARDLLSGAIVYYYELGLDFIGSNIYTIPPNYTDSGKLFGGLLEVRNTVEAGVLLVLVGYPELMWLHLPVTAKVTVMTVTLLPLTIFALMGLGGGSLLQYVTHIALFWIHCNYVQWMSAGGITGEATIAPIKTGILDCWANGVTLTGLIKYDLFIIAVAIGVYAFFRLQDRFSSRDRDARNFSRSKRGTYGTAGWMGDQEMRTILEVASPGKARGIILGQNERGSVICLPENTRLNKHIAVFGASGTMKSRGVIRPALFQCIRRGESAVVADPKSEMYADTVELFRKHGYTVRVYNLLKPELSDSWNCMFDLGGDTLMAQVLTDVIISNTRGGEKGDHFWDSATRSHTNTIPQRIELCGR